MHAYISGVCSGTHPPKRMHARIMNHTVCEHWCPHACTQLASSIPTYRPVFLHAHRSHSARAGVPRHMHVCMHACSSPSTRSGFQGACMYACMRAGLLPGVRAPQGTCMNKGTPHACTLPERHQNACGQPHRHPACFKIPGCLLVGRPCMNCIPMRIPALMHALVRPCMHARMRSCMHSPPRHSIVHAYMHGLSSRRPGSPDQAWNAKFSLVTGVFGGLSCLVGSCGLGTALFPTQVRI